MDQWIWVRAPAVADSLDPGESPALTPAATATDATRKVKAARRATATVRRNRHGRALLRRHRAVKAVATWIAAAKGAARRRRSR